MVANNNTKSKALAICGYVVAFIVCWVTQAIFWKISWRRGSLLAFVLLRCEEFLRVSAQRIFGEKGFSYPPSGHALSVVMASLVVAIPLALAFWLAAGAETRALSWLGYAALVLLAFMTFYWPSIPRDLF
jgi:hypothetical protein